MNSFLPSGNSDLWQLAGWTMLHFLWLGTLVALAAMACRLVFRRAPVNVRYAAAIACFALLAALPVVIAAWLATKPHATYVTTPEGSGYAPQYVAPDGYRGAYGAALPLNESVSPASSLPEQVQSAAPTSELLPRANAALESCARYLPWLWLVGTPLTFVLLTTGLVGAERLRRASRGIDDGPITEACARLSEALHISRRVTVAVCERIAAPVLVGIVRPIILLPPAALTGWSPDEIEMVLLHELAHVRRWDNLINLAQRIVESLLFFHPAVWLLSSWVRREREACCDAVVVGRTNRPHAYAEMLVALAAQMPRSVLFHPAATSAMAAGPLRGRIRRVLGLEDDPMLISGKSLAAVMAGLLLAATLVVLNLPMQSQAEESATKSEEHAEENSKDDASRPSIGVAVFHGVPFEGGASRFAEGDAITITGIKGTSTKFEPGNLYQIHGRYTLTSRDRATLAAFVTARSTEEGGTETSANQSMIVDRGSGTFMLEMPMKVRGWPHVSFYPIEGGPNFGGVYTGTGDSTLKYWRDVHGSNYAQWSENDVAARADELTDHWPTSSPSPTERFIARRAFKTLGIRLLPATSMELKAVHQNRGAGLKVVDGFPPLTPDVRTVVLEAIHGSKIRTFDDVDRILDVLEDWTDPVKLDCITETDGGPKDLHFRVVPRNPMAPEIAIESAPGKTAASKFPSLDDQKLADLAWKRMGLELEPIGDEDLKRVQAFGYAGGLKVTSGAQGIEWNNILVGLHVWPTTNLQDVAAVLNRPDLSDLNPLKFYVVRTSGGDFGGPVKDVVETGRIKVALDDTSGDPMTPQAMLQMIRREQPADATATPDEELSGSIHPDDGGGVRLVGNGLVYLFDSDEANSPDLRDTISQLRDTYALDIWVVDARVNPEVAKTLAVSNFPATVSFKDGKKGIQVDGEISESAVRILILSAFGADAILKPVPPTSQNTTALRYEGGTFDEWRTVWRQELSTTKRLEAVKALAAFGASGKGREAAEAIIEVAPSYNQGEWYQSIHDSRTGAENLPQGRKLLVEIANALGFGSSGQSPFMIPFDDTVAALESAGRSPDVIRRRFAATLLAFRSNNPKAEKALLPLLIDEDDSVRKTALQLYTYLTSHTEPRQSMKTATDYLEQVISDNKSPATVEIAKESLATLERSSADGVAGADADQEPNSGDDSGG